MRRTMTALLIAGVCATAAPGARVVPSAQPVEGYADLAGLTLGAPVVVRAVIAKAEKLGPRDAPDVPAGQVRMLMTAGVQSAIAAPSAVAPVVTYLWQGPLDARGKPPKLKGAAVLLFLRPVPGREDQVRLVSPNAQIAATAAAEARVRAIIAESRTAELRDLRVTGVANAFHVRGSVPGEAETQIFLATASRPVSAVVLSRPGQAKTYSIATGDVIDEAARPAARDTLLWYRLACGLPRTLPDTALSGTAPEDREATAADYRFLIESLGPCGRTLR